MVTGGRAAGAALGLALDRALGEPPSAVHPVALFGTAMGAVERRLHPAPDVGTRTAGGDRRERLGGVAYAAVGVGLGVGAGLAMRAVLGRAPSGVPVALATAVASAGRSLGEAASSIGEALTAGDLDLARERLPSLVGRDPSTLGADEIARAVVESLAENTVDAVVAPAFWAAVAGAPGVLGHRAVNTMDAMVGYRNERYARFGTAAARLDDVAAYVPARLTALLVVAARPSAAAEVRRVVRRDAAAHPSPNAGVAEAAFAAALGVRLGGENRYGDRVEVRATLGDGRPVTPADIPAAVRLSRDCTIALGAVLAAVAAYRRSP